jgi:preprotein translocase subunit SecG
MGKIVLVVLTVVVVSGIGYYIFKLLQKPKREGGNGGYDGDSGSNDEDVITNSRR